MTAPALEGLGAGAGTVLLSLHRAACSLLKEIFEHYPTHRKGLLVELLAQLSESYAVKNPYRSYALSSDAAAGEGGKFASMGVVALLSCLQSVISTADSLVVKKNKPIKKQSPEAVKTDTAAPSSGAKNKAKKGSSSGSTKQVTTALQVEEEAVVDSTEGTTQFTVENAKKSVMQTYICCSIFANELFQVNYANALLIL